MRDVHASGMRIKLFVAALTLALAPASARAQVKAQAADATRQTKTAEQTYTELPNFHAVNARLYRGGQPRADGLRRLAALGVKTVINLRDDDERARAEEKEAKAAGLRYFNVPLGRLGRPKDTEVEHVLALIDAPENGVVFVHCAKGQDRTGTVVAVYRITHDGWTSEQAKREANHYGMKFWQNGMKDYISDYYRDHSTGKR
jgi:protein tyrosine/serine phosphatase